MTIVPNSRYGRPAKYCGGACRQAAYRARQSAEAPPPAPTTEAPPAARPAAPAPAAPAAPTYVRATHTVATPGGSADEVLHEVIKDLQDGTRELARILQTSDAEEALHRIYRMQEQLECLTAGFVGLARHRRVTWGRISTILRISEDTARHRYTEDHILRRLNRFMRGRDTTPASLTDMYASTVLAPPPAPAVMADKVTATEAGPAATPETESSTTPRDPSGAAYNRLAPVLSMLVRTSKQTNKEVSARMGISASYLSRLVSGERIPTWSLTQKFARACGADPDVLRTVWESEKLRERARGPQPPLAEPALPAALRLHQAVRTLHLRAGRPASQDIALASHWALSVADVASVTECQKIPSWRVLKAFVLLLGGDREYFRRLWTDANTEIHHGPTGTEPQPPTAPESAAPADEPTTGISTALEAFSSTLNEDTTIESQMARLLDKRSQQTPTRRAPRLSELAARRPAGRNWTTMRIARPGL
ncbi:helix-turn-helix domain-containing protein [Streptomyces sp. NPDC060333]|uniref:helix-turn-helix domain-containing protein n=1 Tax=Streptomyces sp. NPDC060333 TaxID=3347098 RepID=UPI00365B8356